MLDRSVQYSVFRFVDRLVTLNPVIAEVLVANAAMQDIPRIRNASTTLAPAVGLGRALGSIAPMERPALIATYSNAGPRANRRRTAFGGMKGAGYVRLQS